MTNIVGDQNRRGAAKSKRKLWDVKSGQFIIILNGTENCVPKPIVIQRRHGLDNASSETLKM